MTTENSTKHDLKFVKLGNRISVNIYILNSHLGHFPANLGTISEEQVERFYQDIREIETRYQSQWNENMMTGYC